LLAAAERALVARGLVIIDGNATRLDPALHAAVSICAHPDQMVALIDRRAGSPARRRYFYRVPELTVAHTFPHAGLHDLQIAAGSDMGAAALDELLYELPDYAMTTPRYILQQTQFGELQRQAEEGTAEPLASAELPTEHALSLHDALARPRMRVLLQLAYRAAPAAEQYALALIAGEQACWLIQTDELDSVALQAVSAAQAAAICAQARQPLNDAAVRP
jgi:hypothetical protein